MPTCPHCDATIPEGANSCRNCGASLSALSSTPQPTSSKDATWSTTGNSGEMLARLEKATKHAELLGYAVAGLAVVILIVIIVIYLLP